MDDPAAAAALSRAFDQPLALRRETTVRHHDESGVHLLTSASVRRVEQLVGGRVDPGGFPRHRRGRQRGVDFLKDAWAGGTLAIGPEVVLTLGAR